MLPRGASPDIIHSELTVASSSAWCQNRTIQRTRYYFRTEYNYAETFCCLFSE